MALGSPFCFLVSVQPRTGHGHLLSFFSGLCYIRILNGGMGEERGEGVAGQEEVRGAARGEEPKELSQW